MPAFIYNLLDKLGLYADGEAPPGSPPDAIELLPDDALAPIGDAQLAEGDERYLDSQVSADLHDPAPPPRPKTRILSLSELMSEMVHASAEEAEQDLAQDLGLDATWLAIYEAAGLTTPEHGWNIERALAFIRAAQGKGMTPPQIGLSLERALVDHGADVVGLANEAVAKDEVLDIYEQKLEASVMATLQDMRGREGQLVTEIERLRAEVTRLQRERESCTRRLAAWKSEKSHMEQQWARVLHVIAPLLAERQR